MSELGTYPLYKDSKLAMIAYYLYLYIFYLTHYVFTVFKKYTKYRIMLKIVEYDLKNA